MQEPREPINLKSLADERYRITEDESAKVDRSQESRNWCVQIPCKHGHVGVHSDRDLRAYCKAARLFARLVDISSARVIQDGDKEIAFAFLPHFQSTGGRIAPDLKVRHRSGCQALATVRRMSLEHCQSYLLMRPVVCRPCHSADLTH
jgi:hypothetical protein